jgi:ketosteroid isomerase-like protein
VRRPSLVVVLSAALVAACANPNVRPPSLGPSTVVPGIAAAFSACDMQTLLAHYDATVEFVSPNTPEPLVGRQAIEAYFLASCKGASRPLMKVEAQRVRLLSEHSAVVTGTYSFGNSAKPNEMPWSAFFVITLRKVQGSWFIQSQATFPIPE